MPAAVGALPKKPVDSDAGGLHRGLSTRQVQMIAIAGTIGTGLFLGTGVSLAQGGPASMLICYAIIGFIVYVTLLLLGEMATQYPVAGEDQNFSLMYWHSTACVLFSSNGYCIHIFNTPLRPRVHLMHGRSSDVFPRPYVLLCRMRAIERR
jgi:amino acid permease